MAIEESTNYSCKSNFQIELHYICTGNVYFVNSVQLKGQINPWTFGMTTVNCRLSSA